SVCSTKLTIFFRRMPIN
ncbi:ROK family protein, partial [Vibrio parahaemolyticus V-223/04]